MIQKARGLWSSTTITAISFAVIIGGVSLAPTVSAIEENIEQRTTTSETKPTTERSATSEKSEAAAKRAAAEAAAKERKAAMEAAAKERREAVKEKLSAAKLQICNDRKANIDNRVTRISERVTKHLALFDNIAQRAQTFYVNKGNALENYDALVADMEAKKAAAKTAAATLESQRGSFDCEGDNPKAAIAAYKDTLKDTIEVLKEYRTSIKNLIVGIKSVNATDTASKPAGETE